jgi:hypothetical protein
MPFRSPYIATVELITRFDRFEDVRKTQFVFEDNLKEVFRGKTQQVPRPSGANPDAPWFLIADGPKFLIVSETSAQIALNFQDNRGAKDIISTIERHARALDSAVSKSVSTEKRFSGIVVTINYPTGDGDAEAIQYIADSYLKTERLGAVISAQVSIGYQKDEDTYVVYTAQPYRNIELQQTGSESAFVDLESAPAREVGLQIKVDVNCRPLSGKTSADRSLSPLVGQVRSALSSGFTTVLGSGIQTVEVS